MLYLSSALPLCDSLWLCCSPAYLVQCIPFCICLARYHFVTYCACVVSPPPSGMALMVICMTGGGLIRDFVTDIYYQ